MATKNDNSVPDLTELIAYIRSDEDPSKRKVFVELRIATAEIDDDGISFDVRIKRLWLDLQVDGLKIVPGSRFGEFKRESQIECSVSETATESQKRTLKGEVKIAVDKDKFDGDSAFEAGKSREVLVERKQEKRERDIVPRVRTLPNSRWEVREPREAALDGSYLDNDCLCELEPTNGSNREYLKIRAICAQSDLVLEAKGGFFERFPINKQRMLQTFLAKCIANSPSYRGKITLSEMEYFDEI